jgi:hypothetical protein
MIASPSALSRRISSNSRSVSRADSAVDAGLGVDGAGDLDQLALGDRQGADQGGRAEAGAQPLQHVLAAGQHRLAVDEGAGFGLAAEIDVLRHRQVRRQAQLLVDHGDAELLGGQRPGDRDVLAVEADGAPGIGLVGAGQHLHQGRFAGAVLAHQGMDLARIDGQVHPGQRPHPREGLGDAVHLQDRRGASLRLRHGRAILSHRRCGSGSRPAARS